MWCIVHPDYYLLGNNSGYPDYGLSVDNTGEVPARDGVLIAHEFREGDGDEERTTLCPNNWTLEW